MGSGRLETKQRVLVCAGDHAILQHHHLPPPCHRNASSTRPHGLHARPGHSSRQPNHRRDATKGMGVCTCTYGGHAQHGAGVGHGSAAPGRCGRVCVYGAHSVNLGVEARFRLCLGSLSLLRNRELGNAQFDLCLSRLLRRDRHVCVCVRGCVGVWAQAWAFVCAPLLLGMSHKLNFRVVLRVGRAFCDNREREGGGWR